MTNHDPLRVKPVKRYAKPKYPSHLDPDPTQFPTPVSNPVRRSIVAAIAASAGLLTTVGCDGPVQIAESIDETNAALAVDSERDTATEQQVDGELEKTTSAEVDFDEQLAQILNTVPPDNWASIEEDSILTFETSVSNVGKIREKAIADAGGNPFCLALSGLPHQTSAFGTGMPNYVNADLARQVIDRVFKQEGFRLKANQQIDRKGVAFIADGYDEAKKVGFVIAGFNNLDDDALTSWSAPARNSKDRDHSAEIDYLLRVSSADPTRKSLVQDIQAAKSLSDPARREAAYKAILDQHRKTLLSLTEVRQTERLAKQGEAFIAVVSCFDNRFAGSRYGGLSMEDRRAIANIADPAKRQAAENRLIEKKAAVVVEALENAAREYIQWARTQGLN